MPIREPPLNLPLRHSRCLLAAWVGLHLAALAAVALCDCGWWAKLGAPPALLAHGVAGWRRQLHWPAGSRLHWSAAGAWTLALPGAEPDTHTAWEAPWVHPRLVVLRLGEAGRRRRTVVLCADALPADLHRRLRVRLRAQPAAPRGT